jgi:Tfp pilus assembly protein PilV
MPSARGFSLIETLIATTIVTGALGTLAGLVSISVHSSQRASVTTTELMAADEKVQELFDTAVQQGSDVVAVPGGAACERHWRVEALADAPPGTTRITVKARVRGGPSDGVVIVSIHGPAP